MDEEIELDALVEELGLTPDVLLGPDIPAILANRRDGEHVKVGVGDQKWVWLASYASLERICAGQVAALEGFSLGVYVMPYFPASEAELLRSGICQGVAFHVLNAAILGTKAVAAGALLHQRDDLTSLVKDIQAAIDELSELGCTAEDPPPPSYSAEERKAANLRFVRALIDEGRDPHNTILHVDATIYRKIYCQDGAYDPCEPSVDSDERRNLTEASLHKLIEYVPASNRKTASSMILEMEAAIADDSVALIESKMVRLLIISTKSKRCYLCQAS